MKNEKKYITLNEDGCDFRTISEIMTDMGYQMNHATVRNQLFISLQSLLSHMSQSLESPITKSHIEKILKSQHVHENLSDVLYKAYEELRKEGDKNEF